MHCGQGWVRNRADKRQPARGRERVSSGVLQWSRSLPPGLPIFALKYVSVSCQVTIGNLRRVFQVNCSRVIKLRYVIAYLQRKPGGVMHAMH